MNRPTDDAKGPPLRTPEEEEGLIRLQDRDIVRCSYCGKEIIDWENDLSTEDGIFYACTDCWRKWGNPSEDL